MPVSAVLSLFSLVVTAASAGPDAPAATQSPPVRAKQMYLQTEAVFLLDHNGVEAEEGFLNVTRIAPTYAPAWFNLAVLAEGKKDWVKAQGYFQRYLTLQPSGPDADRARSQLELLVKYKSGPMSTDLTKSMEYDTCIHRARAFASHGLYREAIAEAGQAQGSEPTRWEAYAVVSLVMTKQNKPHEAAKFTSLALQHAPAAERDEIKIALTSGSTAATH